MLPSINNIICIIYDEVKSNMKGVLLYVVQPADAQSIRNDFCIVKEANFAQPPPLPPSIYPTQTDNRYSNVNEIYPSKNSRVDTPISSRESPLSNDIHQPIQQSLLRRVSHTQDGKTTSNRNSPLFKQPTLPLPAIKNQQNEEFKSSISLTTSKDASLEIHSPSDEFDLALRAVVFRAKKTSVNDLSQGACSYLWFQRFKEIFLLLGKQNDAFSRFDMELARTDMIQTCEQYLESERPNGGGFDLVCMIE